MSRDTRKQLIEQLEAERGTRVLTYVTGDRPPTPAQIGEDAVRPIFDELAAIGHVPKLDLLIYSRGGALETPWRIASALRSAADQWEILVPFRANSAATLLALGADKIVLGNHGELGPIDPILNIQRSAPSPGTAVQDTINVEDVMAYLRFVREEAGLTDQDALSNSLKMLSDRLDAVDLGSVYRTRTHIRDVARRMLTSQKKPPTERVMETIVETLAERVYAHGHAIGFGEAKDIGLPVVAPTEKVEELMWSLLNEYETDMKVREPIDAIEAVANTDLHVEDGMLAVTESSVGAHEFRGTIEVRAKRQIPPTLNVSLNLNLGLPQNVDPNNLPAGIQELLQGAQQAIFEESQKAVQQALTQQAPLLGAEVRVRGGSWVKA